MTHKSFVYCEKCHKKLLERLPNGLWRFIFGGKSAASAPVDLTISGSVRIKCLRKSCKHINVFNYFPNKNNA